ncbi:hypothetical protein Sango_2680300 [Sesamum angolense]|uniref:Reverse transcriptase RNase H-like domain-containing protein n=1 Tax=Sesamum angolense TaxID=2727404 RepID=A0AAE2BHG3_9LAMI|nr:hypothetical protein Sango_2680300 [Sesamum angolense]
MQLGDVPLEAVDTSLYGFAGNVVHPRGMISLPLTLGTTSLRKTCLLKFLVVDILSAYNVILVTKIGSKITEDVRIKWSTASGGIKSSFAWTPQDLEGIDPGVIMYHLKMDPSIRLVNQKKRHFGPEKDKIIQEKVNKLLSARHIKEIQFSEWLSNIVLVPKPGGKWWMCIYFWDLDKAGPKDFYSLLRIDQLVHSTSGCELLSIMYTSQGYHQIMLTPEDHKRVSFISSKRHVLLCSHAFGLKNAGVTYQRLVDKIFQPQLGRNMEAVSSVLVLEEDGAQTPIYYISKVLNGAECRYPSIENMTLALVITASKLCPYFLSYPVGARTNTPKANPKHLDD